MQKKIIIFETLGIDKKRAKKLKDAFYKELAKNEAKTKSAK